MIVGFRHRGLKRLFERQQARGVPAAYREKIERVLFALDAVTGPEALDIPGYGLHRLKGDLTGFWSIVVSRNWRIVFRFDGENATDVDLVDYH